MTKPKKSASDAFNKKAPKKTKKTTTPAPAKEKPYTGGGNWCGTSRMNRRNWQKRSRESW